MAPVEKEPHELNSKSGKWFAEYEVIGENSSYEYGKYFTLGFLLMNNTTSISIEKENKNRNYLGSIISHLI